MENEKVNETMSGVANVSIESQVSENLYQMFMEKPDHELRELTSQILKMEAGEEINGIWEKETEFLTDEKGEDYTAVIVHKQDIDGNREKCLIADAVVVSAHSKFFANWNNSFAPVRLKCKGKRKTSDGKREYRDIQVFTI